MATATGERFGSRQATVLALATTAMVSVSMASLGLAPLASLLQADFGVTRTQLGVLLAASSTGSMLVSLPSGWLTDTLGVRRTLLLGLGSTGVLLACVGLANSLPLAVALMFLAGLGIGCISPATTKAILYWFPVRIRGTAMGIKQMGYPLGGALAAAVLPTLALLFGGWRAAVMAVGMLALAVGLLGLWTYHEQPAQRTAGSARGGALASGAWRLLRDYRFVSATAFCLCSGFVQSALMGYLSLFLQEVLLMPVVAAGGYLALTQAVGAGGRVGWGLVSDGFFGGRRRPVLMLLCVCQIVLALAMSTVGPSFPTWLLTAVVCIFGLVAIGWSGVFHTFVGEIAGRDLAGTATGTSLFIGYIGVVTGPPLFGYLVDALHSYATAWALLVIPPLVALLLLARAAETAKG